jgi:hypothetical protein
MTGRPYCDAPRVVACALVSGLLFAVLNGLVAGQSPEGESDGAGASVRTELDIAPAAALVGFLAGAPIGMVAGVLWARPGVAGLIGMAAVAAIAGLAGLAVAAWAGAESRVVATGTSISVEYGAPPPILFAGAAAGVALGGLLAWRLRPRCAVLGPTS